MPASPAAGPSAGAARDVAPTPSRRSASAHALRRPRRHGRGHAVDSKGGRVRGKLPAPHPARPPTHRGPLALTVYGQLLPPGRVKATGPRRLGPQRRQERLGVSGCIPHAPPRRGRPVPERQRDWSQITDPGFGFPAAGPNPVRRGVEGEGTGGGPSSLPSLSIERGLRASSPSGSAPSRPPHPHPTVVVTIMAAVTVAVAAPTTPHPRRARCSRRSVQTDPPRAGPRPGEWG